MIDIRKIFDAAELETLFPDVGDDGLVTTHAFADALARAESDEVLSSQRIEQVRERAVELASTFVERVDGPSRQYREPLPVGSAGESPVLQLRVDQNRPQPPQGEKAREKLAIAILTGNYENVSEQHKNWVIDGLRRLLERAESGATDGVIVSKPGRRFDRQRHHLDGDRVRASIERYEDSGRIWLGTCDTWVLSQLYPVPDDVIDTLSGARTLGELHDTFTEIGWHVTEDGERGLLTYVAPPHAIDIPGHSRASDLRGGPILVDFDPSKSMAEQAVGADTAQQIADAVRASQLYICAGALPRLVADCDTVGALRNLLIDNLHWQPVEDDRSHTEKISDPSRGVRLTVDHPGVGGRWRQLTAQEKRDLARTVEEAGSYATPTAAERIDEIGRATPEDLDKILESPHLGHMRYVFESMHWTSEEDDASRTLTFTNPRFDVSVTFDLPEPHGRYRDLSTEERERIAAAVRNFESYTTQTAENQRDAVGRVTPEDLDKILESRHLGEMRYVFESMHWTSKEDDAARTLTFTNPRFDVTVTFDLPEPFGSYRELSVEEREAIAAAVRDLESYTTQIAENQRDAVGRATPEDLKRIQDAPHLGMLQYVFGSMRWKRTEDDASRTVTFANPRFDVTVTIDLPEPHGRYRDLSTEERERIAAAVRNLETCVVERPAGE